MSRRVEVLKPNTSRIPDNYVPEPYRHAGNGCFPACPLDGTPSGTQPEGGRKVALCSVQSLLSKQSYLPAPEQCGEDKLITFDQGVSVCSGPVL